MSVIKFSLNQKIKGNKENIKNIFSLKKIESLEEISTLGGFFCDFGYNDDNLISIYPQKNTHHTHDLIKLYGVNFRYFLELNSFDLIKDNTRGIYVFTKRYLESKESLYTFNPSTLGWKFYKEILIPRYNEDKRRNA